MYCTLHIHTFAYCSFCFVILFQGVTFNTTSLICTLSQKAEGDVILPNNLFLKFTNMLIFTEKNTYNFNSHSLLNHAHHYRLLG